MLTGGILTWFGMFGAENASSDALQCICDLSMRRCCRKNFWPCFTSSTDMFDFCFLVYVWQVVSWHVLACLSMRRCCKNFWPCFRWSTDMFDFCFLLYVWQVVSWHVLACLSMRRCCCFHICLTGVLLMSSGQEMTSVQQIAKKDLSDGRGSLKASWITRRQPSPDNLHPTCHGGDHSK